MKGVATGLIIAVILGIIVLAIAVYLISRALGGKEISCEECRALLTSWCIKCSPDFPNDITIGEKICDCSSKCNLISCARDSTCENLNTSDGCQKYIPRF